MKYIYKHDSISYKKTEESGSALIVTDSINNQLFLNPVGVEILNYLPEYSESSEILSIMSREYPDVDDKVLEFDLIEIMRILELYGIIECCDEGSFSTQGDVEYVIAGDLYYKQVSRFIVESLNNDSLKHFQEKDDKYYTPQLLRFRTMENYEYGVFAINGCDIIGYMALSCSPVALSAAVMINCIFVEKSLTHDEMKLHLGGMLNRLMRLICSQKKINKIRIAYVCATDEEYYDDLLSILKKIGFEHECTLKRETTLGDLQFFSLFL